MKKNFSLNNIKNHNFSIGRRIFHILDSIVDFTMLSLFLLMLASGFYAIWDSQQIMQEADSVTYKTYKPSENPKTFEELQKINPDVFGWLTVYGTHIDFCRALTTAPMSTQIPKAIIPYQEVFF